MPFYEKLPLFCHKKLERSNIHITAIAPYRIFPAKTGGQKCITSFYLSFSKILNTTVISIKNNENPTFEDAEFLPILGNSFFRYINFFIFIKLRRILLEKKSTHLIIEHPYFGWLGILSKYFLKVKFIVRSHNIESLRFKSTGKWWWGLLWHYEKFTHRHADLNFFITDEDKYHAIEHFKLDKNKCHTITYGVELGTPPALSERIAAKNSIHALYEIPKEYKILLFNGTLDYAPNLNAVKTIVNKINPFLKSNSSYKYKIIICGKNLPSEMNHLNDQLKNNIIYAGFVEDISLYFKAADIFINPVTDGGGIKTKLVEALGFNLNCISTKEGAFGIPAQLTNEKLSIIIDKDWKKFADEIMNDKEKNKDTDDAFYNHFLWKNIVQKAAEAIQSNS